MFLRRIDVQARLSELAAGIPFCEGLAAFCFGGASFFGLRVSLLPLRWLFAMGCSSFAFEPRGQRSDPDWSSNITYTPGPEGTSSIALSRERGPEFPQKRRHCEASRPRLHIPLGCHSPR